MSSHSIARHCAATLAGHKMGSLFSCQFTDFSEVLDWAEGVNTKLNGKGIYVLCIPTRANFALIYVYRKSQLEGLLSQAEIQDFLADYGYEDYSVEGALALLTAHLRHSDFPHEIGIFLGYPLADVADFIAHGGRNYKFVGCWKVYHNEDFAQRCFDLYDKCVRVYCQRLEMGFQLEYLTVAG